MKRLLSFGAACALVFGVMAPMSALAQTVTAYTCKINNTMGHGMVPEVMFIGHTPGKKTATVSDPVILHFNDRKPMSAKVTRDTPERLKVRWTVRNVQTTTLQKVRVQYTAEIKPKTGAIYVAARVTDFRGQLSGQGKCESKQVKPKS